MRTPASFKDHPIHPILVAFPIGLWTFSVVCDIVYRLGGHEGWDRAALYSLGVGIIGALLAAVPGFVDLLSLRHMAAWTIGLWHMAINLVAVLIFTASFFLRLNAVPGGTLPMVLSLLGVGLILVSGYLGGDMVYRHGIGVVPGAEGVGASAEERERRPRPAV